jgi:hypothetical protein
MSIGIESAALALGSLLLLAAGSVLAQSAPLSPRLRIREPLGVRDPDQPIGIASLDVRVLIHGLHAETSQTVVFHNPNGRVLEGDLEFPLPDGAAVSGFALDLDGQLVDGVVVSKEKARVVLETEIRKGVDPGLAEQVRGNLYRARIYPIPAHGTRTVRLRWVSELTTRGADAAYHLPLPYERPIGEVAMRVEVVRAPVKPEVDGGFGNLTLKQWEDRWVAEAKFAGAAPARDLLVRLPAIPGELIDVEAGEGDEAFFSASALVPERAAPKGTPPGRVALAWDASGSRTAEQTERELAFLEALLSKWRDTQVDLVVFRDRAEAPVAFPGGDGHARLLRALREAPVDGGTALAALDLRRAALPHKDDALWILASDGLATLGEALPAHGDVPVFAATGASVADRALLRHLCGATGGELLDLVALDASRAAAAVARPGVRLLRVAAAPGAVADVQFVQRADRARAMVTGRLLAEQAELTLFFGAGAEVLEQRTVALRRSAAARKGDRPGPVATAWAQGRAEALSIFADRNADALLALGRRFGLATANSSLLVLETLGQHLEHQVEPPVSRAALRAEYLARIGERDKQERLAHKDHLERVVQLWQARVAWWGTDFAVPPGWRWHADAPKKGRAMRGAAAGPPMMEATDAPPSMALAAPAPAAAPGGARERSADKKKEAKEASAEASIAIKAWDPDVPYLRALKAAPEGTAYAAYLGLRAQYAGPAFFLDCAELFLRKGDRALGLRVLSNLAELRLDDPPLLRVLAWRLSQAGELDLAAAVLEKVLRLRPEEPQSRRDLGLVLADRAEAQERPADAARALGLLYEVVQRGWDRFPEIELIALMEVNRLIARAERRGWAAQLGAERVDPRLRKLLDVDLRVSLAWDADLTDVDLHVFEPTGEEASFRNQRTRMGGLVSHDITQGYGPEEYLVRRALPGQYAVKVHYYGSRQQTLVGPATMVATVFTNWGRPDEKREVLTLRLDSPRDMEEVGVVTIGGRDVASSTPEGAGSAVARTLAAFVALRRGMSADQVTAAVGQPDAVGGSGQLELRYGLIDGTEVRLGLGEQGLRSVRHLSPQSELELLP